MKKSIFIFSIIGLFIILVKCTSQKKAAYYVLPDQYTGQTRENMIKMLDDGQKLFKIHCSSCHGIFTKGKDSIPNFSKTQIESYGTAALQDDPKNHAVAQKIRPYDLDLILQFLLFRRPPEVK